MDTGQHRLPAKLRESPELKTGRQRFCRARLSSGALLTAFLSIALLPVRVQAQETRAANPSLEGLPSAETILAKYVEAVGGRAAIEKFKSRISRGTIELPAMNVSGTIEVFEKAPNKALAVIDLSYLGIYRQGFDGATGWTEDPQNGLREVEGAARAAAERDADFYWPLRLARLYAQLIVRARLVLDGREAWVVEAVPAEGAAEKLFFDVESGLLVRKDTERELAEGKVQVENYFEDYREFDGLRLPTTIREWNPLYSYTMKITAVEQNPPIEDSRFRKPEAEPRKPNP